MPGQPGSPPFTTAGCGVQAGPTPLVLPSAIYHLGYLREELIGQSWYSLLHPEDADVAAAQHRAVGEYYAHTHTYLPLMLFGCT